ncbi:hypothetical protein P280DRAFT_464335 [Massarina eburnea CBS 473.64]|uniref:Histone chaperone domain-containing protein n=1 Tax=Massarina eburnea CBS 473.64 TaxID=1395130 RepID=A0A6A6SI21_9PLEO|nr:hypothetical protein P280DRAFT_464335 [Massarina eburnea CBS 473.64]
MTMTPIELPERTHDRHQKHIAAYDRAANRAKRAKLQHSYSTSASPGPSTLSEGSALLPTGVPEDSTEASDCESDVSSEVSESSEEPSDESEDESDDEETEGIDGEEAGGEGEETVVNVRANRGKKPTMRIQEDDMGDDIRPFLKDFLPKLRAANEELEAQRAAGTLVTAEIADKADANGDINADGGDGGDDEQYIELNLGLGVLQAKGDDASDGDSESESEGESANDEDGGRAETDRLGKLMGRDKNGEKSCIQVVGEGING